MWPTVFTILIIVYPSIERSNSRYIDQMLNSSFCVQVLQSASLCLTTTTPEQLAAALRWYMGPLAHVGAPVEELILTLLLSLRFIGLVFDEVLWVFLQSGILECHTCLLG